MPATTHTLSSIATSETRTEHGITYRARANCNCITKLLLFPHFEWLILCVRDFQSYLYSFGWRWRCWWWRQSNTTNVAIRYTFSIYCGNFKSACKLFAIFRPEMNKKRTLVIIQLLFVAGILLSFTTPLYETPARLHQVRCRLPSFKILYSNMEFYDQDLLISEFFSRSFPLAALLAVDLFSIYFSIWKFQCVFPLLSLEKKLFCFLCKGIYAPAKKVVEWTKCCRSLHFNTRHASLTLFLLLMNSFLI